MPLRPCLRDESSVLCRLWHEAKFGFSRHADTDAWQLGVRCCADADAWLLDASCSDDSDAGPDAMQFSARLCADTGAGQRCAPRRANLSAWQPHVCRSTDADACELGACPSSHTDAWQRGAHRRAISWAGQPFACCSADADSWQLGTQRRPITGAWRPCARRSADANEWQFGFCCCADSSAWHLCACRCCYTDACQLGARCCADGDPRQLDVRCHTDTDAWLLGDCRPASADAWQLPGRCWRRLMARGGNVASAARLWGVVYTTGQAVLATQRAGGRPGREHLSDHVFDIASAGARPHAYTAGPAEQVHHRYAETDLARARCTVRWRCAEPSATSEMWRGLHASAIARTKVAVATAKAG